MMGKKDYAVFIGVVIILLFNVINHFNDSREKSEFRKQQAEHQEFFHDMREFADKGGRNTALMGYQLCEHMNRVAEHVYLGEDIKPIDCRKRYRIVAGEIKAPQLRELPK